MTPPTAIHCSGGLHIYLAEREREYAVAARASGASGARLLTRHLLPAASGYVTTQATLLDAPWVLAPARIKQSSDERG